MPRMTLSAVFAALLMTVACDKEEEKKPAEIEETGVDISNNPLGALGQLAEAGKEMQKKAEEMKNRTPVDPISFKALVALLPEVADWERTGDPRGETSQMGEFRISNASQRYERKNGDERSTMKVSIVDGSYVPMVYAPFAMMSKFSKEGTDGFSKGLKIDGQPAFEEWKKKQRSSTLTILVEDRFLITIEGRTVDEKATRQWASHLPLEKLSTWAKEGVTGDDVNPPDSADAEESDVEKTDGNDAPEEVEAETAPGEPKAPAK